jgi:hypothetical protein
MSLFAQNWKYDFERKGYPDIDIRHADSIASLNVYRSVVNSALFQKIPTLKGDLLYHVVFNDKHQKSEIIKYYPGSGDVGSRYLFDYSRDCLVKITLLKANGKIKYSWVFKDGLLMSETSYGAKQAETDIWTYTYIRDSLIENVVKRDIRNKVEYKLQYFYDSLYRLVESKEYQDHSLTQISKYFYDSKGRLKELWFYPVHTSVMSFCEKSYVMSEIITNENNIPYNYANYQYSDNDRLLKQTFLKHNSALDSYVTYTYEPDGKIKEITEYNKRDSPTRLQVYDYNDSGTETGYKEYLPFLGVINDPMYHLKVIKNSMGYIKRIEIINRYKKETELYTFEYKYK